MQHIWVELFVVLLDNNRVRFAFIADEMHLPEDMALSTARVRRMARLKMLPLDDGERDPVLGIILHHWEYLAPLDKMSD